MIHDVSLKLPEFKGHFSPFDLENLEVKVWRLALGNGDDRDAVESQNAPQLCYSDPRTLNMEEYEGMGFEGYSPISTIQPDHIMTHKFKTEH